MYKPSILKNIIFNKTGEKINRTKDNAPLLRPNLNLVSGIKYIPKIVMKRIDSIDVVVN